MAHTNSVVLRHPVQAVAAVILVPIQAIMVGGISKVLCVCWLIREFSSDDFIVLVIALGIYFYAGYWKKRLGIDWVWTDLVSLLVAVIVCLKMLS